MTKGIIRRGAGDIHSVWSTASTADMARWATTLLRHFPKCAKSRSLAPADDSWARSGASFRTANAATVRLPGSYTAGAREMYCRNVYLRTGLTMPSSGWVIDLGANKGLFSVWAALSGAHVIAVEAQAGYASEIRGLAMHNGVADRVHVEIAFAGGRSTPGTTSGVLADDGAWWASSHAGLIRPGVVCMADLMMAYQISHVGLLKMDIEGGEFAVISPAEDLSWLRRVHQLTLEVHHPFGNAESLLDQITRSGFSIDPRDADGCRVTTASSELSYAYCRRMAQDL